VDKVGQGQGVNNMEKLNKLLSLIIMGIFLVVLVSAVASITNYVYSGTIINGVEVPGTTAVTNVSFIGFVCSAVNCSSVSARLWNGNVINSGNTNYVVLDYPTQLQSSYGYGVYAYKEGYIPFEIPATWYGTGATSENDYLYKKDVCRAGIRNLGISSSKINLGDSVYLSADVLSAINNSGPLDYIPAELAGYYSVNTQAVFWYLNNSIPIVLNWSYFNIPYSSTNKASLVWTPTSPGNYTINLRTTVGDTKCLDAGTNSLEESRNLEVLAPGSINNTAPIISIISPQGIVNYSNVLFRIETNEECKNALVNVDNFGNQTMVKETGTKYFYFQVNLSDGSHGVEFYAENLNNIIGKNQTIFVVNTSVPPLDITPPYVAFVSPENKTYNSSVINLNLINSSDAILTWWNNGTSNLSYFSPVNLILANGSYTFTAYSIDSSNNLNTTSVSFTVDVPQNNTPDTTAPVIAILSPESGKQYNSSGILFNISADEPCQSSWVEINGQSYSLSPVTASSFFSNIVLADGNYNAVISAKDASGNIGSKSINFSVKKPEEKKSNKKKSTDSSEEFIQSSTNDFYYKPVENKTEDVSSVYFEASKEKSISNFDLLVILLGVSSFLVLLIILLVLLLRRK